MIIERERNFTVNFQLKENTNKFFCKRYNLFLVCKKIWIFANSYCFQAEKQGCSQPDLKNRFATAPLFFLNIKQFPCRFISFFYICLFVKMRYNSFAFFLRLFAFLSHLKRIFLLFCMCCPAHLF